ncbi:transmembrane protein, putative [Medicago truncatula]|uniref:Transmembrane protein, putative n=1 Tax=Medicago truncatula TaxID=3880 RepID=A0A072V5W9_MEDTR|nr:transmembrane protein, putative [Medicago truncatula]
MDNLIIKQILQSNVHLYVDGCGKHEDISTLFGFTVVLPARVSDHISQFGNLGGFSRSCRLDLWLFDVIVLFDWVLLPLLMLGYQVLF